MPLALWPDPAPPASPRAAALQRLDHKIAERLEVTVQDGVGALGRFGPWRSRARGLRVPLRELVAEPLAHQVQLLARRCAEALLAEAPALPRARAAARALEVQACLRPAPPPPAELLQLHLQRALFEGELDWRRRFEAEVRARCALLGEVWARAHLVEQLDALERAAQGEGARA
jgi:hypothetical protein